MFACVNPARVMPLIVLIAATKHKRQHQVPAVYRPLIAAGYNQLRLLVYHHPYPLSRLPTMPNKAFYVLSTWLLCAQMAYAATTASALQQQLDALIHDAHADLPYQEGEMVWQDFYRDGKSVVMVYQDVSERSSRADLVKIARPKP